MQGTLKMYKIELESSVIKKTAIVYTENQYDAMALAVGWADFYPKKAEVKVIDCNNKKLVVYGNDKKGNL